MADKEGMRRTGFGKWLLGNEASAWASRMALVPLRLAVGSIMAAHGLQKAGIIAGAGWDKTVEMVHGIGFPVAPLFAALLIIGELVGGVLLILGLAPRLGALAVAIVMVVALGTVHRHQSFFDLNLQVLLLAAAITLFLAGAGHLGLQRSEPKK